jgi:hypothetical protein
MQELTGQARQAATIGVVTASPSLWTSRRLAIWGAGLLFLSWFIYAHTMMVPGLVDRAGRFKGTDHIYFYVMGSLMLDGRPEDLYRPEAHLAEGRRRITPDLALYAPYSNYGPQIAWAFAPLARLPYGWSLALFLALTAILYAVSVWLVWRDLPGLAPHGRLVALLAGASPSFLTLFRYAQLSALSLLLLSLALFALRRDRRVPAGLALGTMVFKPQLGVVTGVVLLVAGEWRIAGAAAIAAAAQLGLAWAVSGTGVMAEYLAVLWSLVRDPSLVQIYPTEVHSIRGFFNLLIPSPRIVSAVSLIALAAILAAGVRVWKGRCGIDLRWGTLVLLTILASPHLLTYDLVLLAVPLLTFGEWAVTHRSDRRHRAISLALLLAYLAPFSSNLSRLWPVQISVLVIAALAWFGVWVCRDVGSPEAPGDRKKG